MKKSFFFAILVALLLGASVSFPGQQPDKLRVSIIGAYPPVSIYSIPDGSGYPLTMAFASGGMIDDGTVSLRLTFEPSGIPAVGVPAEDILLVLGGDAYHLCGDEGAVCGTGTTDSEGYIDLTGPIAGGGHSDPSGEGARVEVETRYLGRKYMAVSKPFPLYMNSPDINGDGVVSLIDVTMFASDKGQFDNEGLYSYRSDFNWDGVIDQTDVDMLGDAYGRACVAE